MVPGDGLFLQKFQISQKVGSPKISDIKSKTFEELKKRVYTCLLMDAREVSIPVVDGLRFRYEPPRHL